MANNIAFVRHTRSCNGHSRLVVLAAVIAALCVLLTAARASAQIKQPGAHPNYSVELEPHFLVWWQPNGWGNGYYDHGTGFGPGMRVNIPFLDNGPISSINNNMAIGFGVDWGHFGGHCGWWGARGAYDPRWYNDCTTNEFWFPVVLQWNFFITKKFSAFGEPGFAIRHTRWNNAWCYNAGPNQYYNCTETDTGPDFYFAVGGRVHISETVAFTFRIGWPYLSLGFSFFL